MRTSVPSLPIILATLLAGTTLVPIPSPVSAAESYDNCTGFIDSLPVTITTQGTWCLRKDLSTSMTTGLAIAINANNVTIECNGFKVGGLAAGTGTSAFGIVGFSSRYNTIVRGCNVRGFLHGISLVGGGGHVIENNRVDSCTLVGISVGSAPGSAVHGNMVIDTGGSTHPTYSSWSAHGINAGQGEVIDNTVDGVAAGSSGNAYGINAGTGGHATVIGNRISEIYPAGSGNRYGIFIGTGGRSIIRNNSMQGAYSSNLAGTGVLCSSNSATARDNAVSGFATGISGCYTGLVNPN